MTKLFVELYTDKNNLGNVFSPAPLQCDTTQTVSDSYL